MTSLGFLYPICSRRVWLRLGVFKVQTLGPPKLPGRASGAFLMGRKRKWVLGWTLSCPQTTRFYLHDVLEFKSNVISTKTLMTSQESVESLD